MTAQDMTTQEMNGEITLRVRLIQRYHQTITFDSLKGQIRQRDEETPEEYETRLKKAWRNLLDKASEVEEDDDYEDDDEEGKIYELNLEDSMDTIYGSEEDEFLLESALEEFEIVVYQ